MDRISPLAHHHPAASLPRNRCSYLTIWLAMQHYGTVCTASLCCFRPFVAFFFLLPTTTCGTTNKAIKCEALACRLLIIQFVHVVRSNNNDSNKKQASFTWVWSVARLGGKRSTSLVPAPKKIAYTGRCSKPYIDPVRSVFHLLGRKATQNLQRRH